MEKSSEWPRNPKAYYFIVNLDYFLHLFFYKIYFRKGLKLESSMAFETFDFLFLTFSKNR